MLLFSSINISINCVVLCVNSFNMVFFYTYIELICSALACLLSWYSIPRFRASNRAIKFLFLFLNFNLRVSMVFTETRPGGNSQPSCGHACECLHWQITLKSAPDLDSRGPWAIILGGPPPPPRFSYRA